MKASEILRRAAKIIEDGRAIGGCLAITEAWVAAGDCSYTDKARADQVFKSHFDNTSNAYWFGSRLRKENQNRRVLALCFAAAIAESEGD